jgi:phosphoribosyl 1,2-cyclic phosphodiesterase
MKIRFPGTRGEIDIASKRHRRHSCLLLEGRILIDCGADWLGRFGSPAAIVLTHAHPDHAGGLKWGAECPVYATTETFEGLKSCPLRERKVITPGEPFFLCGLRFEAFSVDHSLIAPAVGYRITDRTVAVFYIPDVARIPNRRRLLSKISLYIGDGVSVTRPLLRRRGTTMIGHAALREQLDWCPQAEIRRAIFTHCGSEIVRAGSAIVDRVKGLGNARGVDVLLAHDGMMVTVSKNTMRVLN